jgi:ABC-type uncharacterized transport system ATPase subunit
VCCTELQEVAKEAIGEAEKSLKTLQQVRLFVGVNQLEQAVGANGNGTGGGGTWPCLTGKLSYA